MMLHSRTQRHPLTFPLYLNAAVLLVILFVMLARDGSGSFPRILPAAMAQNQLPIGGGAGLFIVPGQFSLNSFGCYLMDVDRQTLCAYWFDPSSKQLRLVSARNFRYDRQLGHFNTASPMPEEVKQLMEQEQAGNRVLDVPHDKPSVEAPPKPD